MPMMTRANPARAKMRLAKNTKYLTSPVAQPMIFVDDSNLDNNMGEVDVGIT